MFRNFVTAIIFAITIALTGIAGVNAGGMGWEKYAQSPGGLAAIASGISMAGSCRKPYQFSERIDGNTTVVNIDCSDDGDGETTIIIRFELIPGSTLLIPRSFELAG